MPVSDQKEAKPTQSRSGRIVIIVAVTGIAAALGAYFYLSSVGPDNDNGVIPQRIDVSGEVDPGADRMPVSLLLKDEGTGETENISFEGTHYEIDIPNGNYDWQITVIWHGETNGQCDGGNLTYQHWSTAAMTHNITCQN